MLKAFAKGLQTVEVVVFVSPTICLLEMSVSM